MSGDDPIAAAVEAVDLDRAADAFRGLGDPVRIGITTALVHAERVDEEPLSFAELRGAVGVSDSGRFNYHLQQLQPRFVASTDDGYRARHAAMTAYDLVLGGAATADDVHREATSDRPCVICESPMTARYEHDRLVLECTRDDIEQFGVPLPPALAADRSVAELIEVAEALSWQQMRLARDGVCYGCWGPIEATFNPPEFDSSDLPPHLTPEDVPQSIQSSLQCERCLQTFTTPLRLLVSDHPAVVAFAVDHGIAADARSPIERFSRLPAVDAGVGGDGGAWVVFAADGDELTIEVDRTCSVVGVDRSSR